MPVSHYHNICHCTEGFKCPNDYASPLHAVGLQAAARAPREPENVDVAAATSKPPAAAAAGTATSRPASASPPQVPNTTAGARAPPSSAPARAGDSALVYTLTIVVLTRDDHAWCNRTNHTDKCPGTGDA